MKVSKANNLKVQYTLKIEEGTRAPQIMNFFEEEVLIGRRNAVLTLNDPQVSGRHAVFYTRDSLLYLKDLKSRNGTRRNGRRISAEDEIEMRSGDVVTLGRHSRITCLSVDLVQTRRAQDVISDSQKRDTQPPDDPDVTQLPPPDELDEHGLPLPSEPDPFEDI